MMELRVCHLYPDVLNLYGDRGNVLCIKKRLEWRGIGCTVTELPIGERRPMGGFDLFFVGGGQDFEQGLLLEDLRGGKGADIRAAAEDGAAFLCVCGGYQLMGHYYDTAAGVPLRGRGRARPHHRGRRGAHDRQLRLRDRVRERRGL